jgi:hypothetical protein
MKHNTDYRHKDEDPLNLTSLGAGRTKNEMIKGSKHGRQAGSMQETVKLARIYDPGE